MRWGTWRVSSGQVLQRAVSHNHLDPGKLGPCIRWLPAAHATWQANQAPTRSYPGCQMAHLRSSALPLFPGPSFPLPSLRRDETSPGPGSYYVPKSQAVSVVVHSFFLLTLPSNKTYSTSLLGHSHSLYSTPFAQIASFVCCCVLLVSIFFFHFLALVN